MTAGKALRLAITSESGAGLTRKDVDTHTASEAALHLWNRDEDGRLCFGGCPTGLARTVGRKKHDPFL